MFLATLLMCMSHPGHFLKGPNSEFPKLSRKEKKAAKAAAKAAKKGLDHDKLLDPEKGYGGASGPHIEMSQSGGYANLGTSEYTRVDAATEMEDRPQRYEPYGGAYGQNEYHPLDPEAGRALS
jgi:hypothetical protein